MIVAFLCLQRGVNMNTKKQFTKEFLISELHRFNNEYGRPPRSKDFDKAKTGFPSRKTYSNYFGTFEIALKEAGLLQKRKTYSKEEIKKCIEKFINENNRVPSLREIESIPDYPTRQDFRKFYGSYNNAIKEFGYKPANVSKYTDEELKSEFERFIQENGRVPSITEFNNSDYPSFWCYQQRFGSWRNAVISYGYSPNNAKTIDSLKKDLVKLCNEVYEKENRKIITYEDINESEHCQSAQTYNKRFKKDLGITLREFLKELGFSMPISSSGMVHEFEDGEITVSRYEFEVSKYLRKNNIKYERNVKYNEFIKGYDGNKDCDYLINFNNKIWYVEVAGMYSEDDGEISVDYRNRLLQKIKMLDSENLNYKILYPKDFKNKTLDKIFNFMFN